VATRGLPALLAAQFCSALADHALLIVAIAMLERQGGGAAWAPLLKIALVAAYVLLAPWIGPLADAVPKPRLMMAMNALKALAVAALLAGLLGPLEAMLLVGLGAAAYAPAKYGLVTELVPAHRLVAANGWLEGLTVAAAVLGTLLGGLLVSDAFAGWLRPWSLEVMVAALLVLLQIYGTAGALNLMVPDSGLRHRLGGSAAVGLRAAWRLGAACVADHLAAQRVLWRDREAALSMAATTLLWGVAAVLQFAVLRWGQEVLGLALDRAAALQALVALGVVAGAAAAGRWVPLQRATRALPLGIALGALLPLLVMLRDPWLGALALAASGALAGWLVVPLNALLQHRGHVLLSAGRSIAVQNFNENASILVMLGVYAALLAAGVTLPALLSMFGALVALVMLLLVLKTARATPRAPTLTMGQAGIAPGAFAMPGGQYGGPKDDDDHRPGHGAARHPRPARPEGRRQDGFHDAQ
jgi:MFS transporter, LPLT family, lysophospholipid transporter